jgi:hypothetical protein
MSKHDFKTLLRQQIRRARARGLRPPVIACLWRDSGHARAAYRDRHGRSFPRRKELAEGSYLVETWTAAEAARLLRLHAGIGGVAVAGLLDEATPEIRWWLVTFQPPSLIVKAFAGRELFDVIVPYDEILDTVCPCCLAEIEGGGAFRCRIDGDDRTVVCGATREDVVETIKLVRVACTGRLPALCEQGAAFVPLAEEGLAHLLLTLYGTRPRVVAEAVMALRKVPGGRDAWLCGVLDGTPSLRELAEAVRREIGGDEAGAAQEPVWHCSADFSSRRGGRQPRGRQGRQHRGGPGGLRVGVGAEHATRCTRPGRRLHRERASGRRRGPARRGRRVARPRDAHCAGQAAPASGVGALGTVSRQPGIVCAEVLE